MKPTPGPKKDNNKKYALIGVLVLVSIVCGSIFFYHYMNHQNAEEYYEHALKEIEYQNAYQAGQYLKASLYFDNEYGDAYFLRGKIRCEFYKEYNLALADLDKAEVYLEEPNSMLFYFKGKCHYKLKNYEEAVNYLEKASAMEPVIDSIHYFLADIRAYQMIDYPKAIEHYTTSLQTGKSYEAYFGKGLCEYNLKRYQEAIKDFDHALKIKPEDGNLFYHKALCEFAMGDIEAGCIDCGNAITVNFEEANNLAAQHCFGAAIDSTSIISE